MPQYAAGWRMVENPEATRGANHGRNLQYTWRSRWISRRNLGADCLFGIGGTTARSGGRVAAPAEGGARCHRIYPDPVRRKFASECLSERACLRAGPRFRRANLPKTTEAYTLRITRKLQLLRLQRRTRRESRRGYKNLQGTCPGSRPDPDSSVTPWATD